MEHSNDNVPTPDDIIKEHGLDQPTGSTGEPEFNPDFGKDLGDLPEEHQIPLEKAIEGLTEDKEAA